MLTPLIKKNTLGGVTVRYNAAGLGCQEIELYIEFAGVKKLFAGASGLDNFLVQLEVVLIKGKAISNCR